MSKATALATAPQPLPPFLTVKQTAFAILKSPLTEEDQLVQFTCHSTKPNMASTSTMLLHIFNQCLQQLFGWMTLVMLPLSYLGSCIGNQSLSTTFKSF